MIVIKIDIEEYVKYYISLTDEEFESKHDYFKYKSKRRLLTENEREEMKIFQELSSKRAKILLRCNELGKQFIIHFHKVYSNPFNQAVNHWCTEMQAWYDKIRKEKYKPDSRLLTNEELEDEFFTSGTTIDSYVDADEYEMQKYEEFYKIILDGHSVREALILSDITAEEYVNN